MPQENRHRISAREGFVTLNGVRVMDSVKFTVDYTPEVHESKALGEHMASRRQIGESVTVKITEFKSTPWLRDAIKSYRTTRRTPEFTIQGVQDDPGSDYQDKYGVETITCTGCVLNAAFNLMDLDSEGDVKQRELQFGAHDFVM